MAAKTEMLKCELNVETGVVTMWHSVRNGDKWSPVNESVSAQYDVSELPEAIRDQCALYGLRAKLQDGTSDFRKMGIPAVMDAMGGVYDRLCNGEWNAKAKRQAGVDAALVQLVAELKQLSTVQAEAALKAIAKEQRDAIAEKFSERLAEIRSELKAAEGVDLDDLL